MIWILVPYLSRSPPDPSLPVLGARGGSSSRSNRRIGSGSAETAPYRSARARLLTLRSDPHSVTYPAARPHFCFKIQRPPLVPPDASLGRKVQVDANGGPLTVCQIISVGHGT